MIRRTRTILFLICLLLFLLIAPTAVFYSLGYRFDFDSKKISQTGGLFLKVLPKQVEVCLDEKLKTKTDFFFGSVLVENLLPKKYKIEVKKESYHPWEKTLEIKEKEVTEAKNIVLFPENPNFSILAKGLESFWFSPDQRKIILKEINPPAGGENSWSLKLYELDRNIKSHLIDEKKISSMGVDLFSLEFSPDSKEIYLEVGAKEQIMYFKIEIDKTPMVLVEKEAPSPPLKNILTYQEINNDIYYLDNFGNLFKNDEKLTETPFPVRLETEYKLKVFEDFISLQEGKNLFKFNSDSKSFEKFFEEINFLKISPDSQKLVYFSDYEIWILYLKEKETEPIKKIGDKVFLFRLSEEIKDCFWLNSDYLVFSYGDKIKISEIDERDRINVVDIIEIKNPSIFWNQIDKNLYILSEENLISSEAKNQGSAEDRFLYRSSALLP